MSKKLLVFLVLISFGLSLGIFEFVYKPNKPESKIVSPVPDFLSISDNNEVSTLDLWTPAIGIFENFLAGNKAPEVSAKSALVYDLTTDKVLYEKNPRKRLPIASLTKLMTAIVGEENQKKDNRYLVHPQDLVGEDAMGLSSGEVLNLDDLLYGLVLHSGNDAGETIASNFPTGRTNFVKAMNQKARSYGLSDSNFTNPTGLEGDGDQYSTAYDLLVISRHAIQFPSLVNVFKTFDYTIPQTVDHKEYDLENETNLISSYPGVEGIKTGFTPEAGLCLITLLDYKGHKILAIILDSDDRRQEMKNLLDYSLISEGVTPPQHE